MTNEELTKLKKELKSCREQSTTFYNLLRKEERKVRALLEWIGEHSEQ